MEKHGASCDCDECGTLLLRFITKSIQTKGIRFKCRLCGELTITKTQASTHLQRGPHAAEFQAFKKQKAPRLFESTTGSVGAKFSVPKISFAREDVLKKRPADQDTSFGGWTKKEKPELPPCERPEYQEEAQDVLTAPPWITGQRPTDENASVIDKEVDGHIAKAQIKRFSKRNVLEINPTSVRCKLCFKVIGTLAQTEKHVIEAHQEDFEKEMKIWERFLFATSKRTPPFGWSCKVCSMFFKSDGDAWRHLGKEVFLRREERHLNQWHEKEDRWGHEEDWECCGDGISFSQGMSYESVMKFQESARQEALAKELGKRVEESSDSDEEGNDAPVNVGQVNPIEEF